MKLSDFDYNIDERLIAQHPLEDRDSSKLLVLDRKTGSIEHSIFSNIVDQLYPGDLLVLNNTKVIPVRVPGLKPTGGKAEITLLRELAVNSWEALVKGVHEGIIILDNEISAQVSRLSGTMAKVDFEIKSSLSGTDIKSHLSRIGVMPLPVYIKRGSVKSDNAKYQTVYAKKDGAVAAPTAGLHFTNTLLSAIRHKGVKIETVTLHVGYGTFKPVTVEDLSDHQMDNEVYEISEKAANAINSAKTEGRRVIAVGTTVTRTLEASSVADEEGRVSPAKGSASIFISPGYRFRVIDALITNFHLPKSTPMILASAFSDLAFLKKAYTEARARQYRFFSYGDAMFIK